MATQEQNDELKELIGLGVRREEYEDRRTDVRSLDDLKKIQHSQEVELGIRPRPPYRKTLAKRSGACP